MEIDFQTSKLERECNDQKLCIRTYGPARALVIKLRLEQLSNADNLEELRKLPQVRCHELKGVRAGQLALDLRHPYRLIIVPANEPIPVKPDGGLDWSRVTKVKILEVVDYHG